MKIGIIGAMAVEVELLKERSGAKPTKSIAGMEFWEGKIGDQEVVIVRSGVGKVNAACCVQLLASIFSVDAVINTGVAGSLDNRINVGDIVVSTDVIHHDVDATVFGYALGEVPQMGVVSFEADEALRHAAVTAVQEAAPEIQAFEGRITTGDRMISDSDTKSWIKENFDGACCEMEGAAIAQASYINGLPFVILRAISDKADESVEVSYDVFEAAAAKHCASLVEYMLRHMEA